MRLGFFYKKKRKDAYTGESQKLVCPSSYYIFFLIDQFFFSPELLSSLNFQHLHFVSTFLLILLFWVDPQIKTHFNTKTIGAEMEEYKALEKEEEQLIKDNGSSLVYYIGCLLLLIICYTKIYWLSFQYLAKHQLYNVHKLAVFYGLTETGRLFFLLYILDFMLRLISKTSNNFLFWWNEVLDLKFIFDLETTKKFLILNYQNFNDSSRFSLVNGLKFINCLNETQGSLFNGFQILLASEGLGDRKSFLMSFITKMEEYSNSTNQKLQIQTFTILTFVFVIYYLIFEYFVPMYRINFILKPISDFNSSTSSSSSSSSSSSLPYTKRQQYEEKSWRPNFIPSPSVEDVSSLMSSQNKRNNFSGTVTHFQESYPTYDYE